MQRATDVSPSDAATEFLKKRIDYERTSLVPYGQRDFRLDRMRELLRRLGNPQDRLQIVHIAGTKGKGSTAAFIAHILQAAGLRAGLYSSPHLDRVEERLAIDGAECPRQELNELVEEIRPVVAEMDALPPGDPPGSNRPTYFEIVTALALLRFARWRVDAAVLEVGMGGRLDSTNVCSPLVSVITSISLDHTQHLGSTLAAIAGEKAGIIKPTTPVISGVVESEPREVITSVAARHGSRVAQLGRDFDFDYRPPRGLDVAADLGHMDFHRRAEGCQALLSDLELGLNGRHQAANASVAIATICELRAQGWPVSEAAIREGLRQVRWPARIEVIARRPAVVLDAAHNVASIEALVRVLDESFGSSKRLLVFAATSDKDVRGMLRALLPKFDDVIFTRYRNNPRGVAPKDLAAISAELSTKQPRIRDTPQAAWKLAREIARPEDLICITGSFFIAGEMRAAMSR